MNNEMNTTELLPFPVRVLANIPVRVETDHNYSRDVLSLESSRDD